MCTKLERIIQFWFIYKLIILKKLIRYNLFVFKVCKQTENFAAVSVLVYQYSYTGVI